MNITLGVVVFVSLATCGLATLAGEPSAPGPLRLPAVLSDNMVLQRDKPVRIWGWAVPGDTVTVTFAGQEAKAATGADGKWRVTLAPMPASGEGRDLTVRSTRHPLPSTLHNILVGEVWLCSGQSNMQLSLSAANGSGPVQEAKYPGIRLFITGFNAPQRPADDCSGQWSECSPGTVGTFSAVAYYFGRKLHQELGVPVGLIQSAHGATAAECWISEAALRSEAILGPIADQFDTMPKDPKGWDPHLPTGLFNGEIVPLAPLAIRGFIWYQGETNAGRAHQYRTLFQLLIRDWRAAWGEELPFYFVQLPNFGAVTPEPVDEPWAELREAQALALKLPHTGMAVAIDIGDAANLHPPNKWDIGLRLALQALAQTYGREVVCSGPTYRSTAIERGRIRVRFDHADGGLTAKGGTLRTFAVAGADRKWVWAEAEIDGDSVVVSNPRVPEPAAVRYAWANNPQGCNLYSQAGLPAAPFRTDTWPGVTDHAHEAKPASAPAPAGPVAPLDAAAPLTGNTIGIRVDQSIERSWDSVKRAGYEYRPRQAIDPASRETHVWLPYGNVRGFYYEVSGFVLTDTAPGKPASVVSADARKPGHLTLKFHFDKPVGAFRVGCGYTEFHPQDAVAGIEYSVDGQTWVALQETATGGIANRLASPEQAKAAGLNTQDLYLRYYARDRQDPASPETRGAWIRTWMGGDPMWGDAATTFFRSQWQLWVTPAGR